MRYLELAVMILTVILSLWMLLLKNKGKPFIVPVVMNTVLLAAHLIVEKPRWQMGIIYFFALILLEYMLWVNIRGKEIRINKVLKGVLTGVAVLLIVVMVLPPMLLPVPQLPGVTGSYAIGVTTFHMRDESRPEIYTEADDCRELMVTVWYPTDKENGTNPKSYISGIEALGEAIRDGLGVPAFMAGYLNLVRSGAAVEAPVSSRSDAYPLLIFSHGLGVPAGFYTSIIRELTSRGYIVAAIEHAYGNAATTFPDGRVADFRNDPDSMDDEALAEMEAVWAGDMSFVIDRMAAMNDGDGSDMFVGRIDMARVGTIGHSFGGGAAYMSLLADVRVRAAINLDGSVYGIDPIFPDESKRFMLITSDDYAAALRDAEGKLLSYGELGEKEKAELMSEGIGEKEYTEKMGQMIRAMEHLRNELDRDSLFIRLEGTKHYNFSDFPLLSPLVRSMGLTGSMDGKRGLEIVNRLCAAFFGECLGNEEGVVDRCIREYSEIHVESLRWK